jgi:hypothetical protein
MLKEKIHVSDHMGYAKYTQNSEQYMNIEAKAFFMFTAKIPYL